MTVESLIGRWLRALACVLLLVVPAASLEAQAWAQAAPEPEASATSDATPLRAVVMQVDGRVRARANSESEWQPLKVNDVLSAGAEVQTGTRSSAALRIGANSTVLIDAMTQVVMPALERDGRLLKTRMLVRSGRADIRVDHVGLDNDFKVLTPSATIAVAGTTLAVVNGQLMGTEVTGARTNLMAAIETQWIERRLAFYFGDGSSNRRFPNPAIDGINRTVERNLLPGVVDDDSQLEQAWFDGSLQNVEFNINNLQRALNLQPPIIDDELAALGALQQLLDIRAKTADEASRADSAAMLAQAFAQKAVQLAAAAQAMLPEVEQVIESQTIVAEQAAIAAAIAKDETLVYAAAAAAAKVGAFTALDGTIQALQDEDFKLAQDFANAASLAAYLAFGSAIDASESSKQAYLAAQVAAVAASNAQYAIDQYFSKVAGAENCASEAAAQASIASNAAQAAKSLNDLAQQLGSLAQGSGSNVSGILVQINNNTNQAIQASITAAQARDQALAAASNARTMGEKALFNYAAVFASQAAADAAIAGGAANQALLDALAAQGAADLAQKLVGGGH